MNAGVTELTMNNEPEREYLKERKRSFKDVAILVGETIDEAFWKVTDSPPCWEVERDLMHASLVIDGVEYRVELREATR